MPNEKKKKVLDTFNELYDYANEISEQLTTCPANSNGYKDGVEGLALLYNEVSAMSSYLQNIRDNVLMAYMDSVWRAHKALSDAVHYMKVLDGDMQYIIDDGNCLMDAEDLDHIIQRHMDRIATCYNMDKKS